MRRSFCVSPLGTFHFFSEESHVEPNEAPLRNTCPAPLKNRSRPSGLSLLSFHGEKPGMHISFSTKLQSSSKQSVFRRWTTPKQVSATARP